MVAEIDREERALGLASSGGSRGSAGSAPAHAGSRRAGSRDGEDLDVPEFIPPG
jgi:hypothetical protein